VAANACAAPLRPRCTDRSLATPRPYLLSGGGGAAAGRLGVAGSRRPGSPPGSTGRASSTRAGSNELAPDTPCRAAGVGAAPRVRWRCSVTCAGGTPHRPLPPGRLARRGSARRRGPVRGRPRWGARPGRGRARGSRRSRAGRRAIRARLRCSARRVARRPRPQAPSRAPRPAPSHGAAGLGLQGRRGVGAWASGRGGRAGFSRRRRAQRPSRAQRRPPRAEAPARPRPTPQRRGRASGRGTRRVQLVRGRDETCPVSTGRGAAGGGGGGPRLERRLVPQRDAHAPGPRPAGPRALRELGPDRLPRRHDVDRWSHLTIGAITTPTCSC